MEPKIRAVIRFLEGGGKEALITSPEYLKESLLGRRGTRIK
jgi:carbamate kinase